MDNVKEAAENLLRFIPTTPSGFLTIVDDEPTREAVKRLKLALAARPADEAVGITEEWLRSVGFEAATNPLYLWIGPDECKLWRHEDGRWGLANLMDESPEFQIPALKTRSDVLRLCAALGIDLKGT